MPFQKEIQDYLDKKRAVWSPATYKGEVSRIRTLIKEGALDRPLSHILPGLRLKYKPYTLQTMLIRLRCLDNEALGGRLLTNAFMAQGAAMFRGVYLGRQFNPSDKQVASILEYCLKHEPKAHNYLYLMAYAGLRKSEAKAVRWEDVRKDGSLLIRQGKGMKDRIVPFPKSIQGNLIMLPKSGTKVCGNYCADAALMRIRKGTGVAFTPHSLRGYAIQRYSGILNPKELQHFAGHSNFNTTMRYIVADTSIISEKINNLVGTPNEPDQKVS